MVNLSDTMSPRRRRSRSRGRGGPSLSRRSAIGLIGAGGALLAAGSGAYFSIMGERPFDIGAADDDIALLGIDTLERSGSEGERVDLLRLTNGFGHSLTEIDVTVEDIGPPDNLDITGIETPDSLAPHGSDGDEIGYVSGVIENCTGQPTVPVDLFIKAAGGGDSVEGTRTAEVRCVVVDIDPYDCRDILDRPRSECAYPKTGSSDIEDDKDGDVCIDGSEGTADVDVSNNVEIDGFLRVIDATDISFTLGNNAMIDGAVNLHEAETNVTATLKNNSHIAGDFCASGNGTVTVDIIPPAAHPRIGGHLSVSAGARAEVDIGQNVDIANSVMMDAGENLDLILGQNAIIEGSVDVDSGQKATVDVGQNAEIHGWARITGSDDADVEVGNNALIDGDLTIEAGAKVDDVDIANNAEIKGDVTITASGDAIVEVGDNALIDGNFTVNAGGEANVTVASNAEITGEVNY